MTKTFIFNLNGLDISEYDSNPVVMWEFDYVNPPIGTAKISEFKNIVEITFFNNSFAKQISSQTRSTYELRESYMTVNDKKVLLGLSLCTKNSKKLDDKIGKKIKEII